MALIVRPAATCLAADSVQVYSDSALDALWAYGVRILLIYQNVPLADFQRYIAKGFAIGFVGFSRPPGWVPSAQTGAEDAASLLEHVHGALSVGKGVTLFDDVEEPSAAAGPAALIAHIDAAAAAVTAEDDIAGDYVGDSCGLTSAQWSARPNVHAYWQAAGWVRDGAGLLVGPARGWGIVQAETSKVGVGEALATVDLDLVKTDYFGGIIRVAVDDASPLVQLWG